MNWKRMEPQPDWCILDGTVLYFSVGPDGVSFELKDGDIDRAMISGKPYRLVMYVEEEV
jgi:hypothetical protein